MVLVFRRYMYCGWVFEKLCEIDQIFPQTLVFTQKCFPTPWVVTVHLCECFKNNLNTIHLNIKRISSQKHDQ